MTRDRLYLIERGLAELTQDDVAEGWHFCPEWYGLCIGPGMPELDGCLCEPRYTITEKGRAMLEGKDGR
jgi:hypothetical protein